MLTMRAKRVLSSGRNQRKGKILIFKIRMKKLFVTCFNCDSKYKIEKTIKNYIDLFINTSVNHMSIRSHLVSQPKNKLISNNKRFFNATDLMPMAKFYLQIHAVKIQEILKIVWKLQMTIKILKYKLSKYY